MLIKCPKCSIGYNIPDEKLGEKPTKMRCARCKTVFAISRRGGSVPAGYEEFTGRQSALPGEFAFLKHAEDKPKSEAPDASGIPRASAPFPPAPVEEDIVQKALREVAEAKKLKRAQEQASRVNVALEQDSIPVDMPAPPTPETQETTVPKTPPTPPASPAAQVVEPAAPVPQDATPVTTSVSDIYGGAQSAWEIEAPLDLGSYEVETKLPSQAAGKIMAVLIVLIAAFFIFVAYRNGWGLSFANLGAQVEFAFSDKKLEVRPHEVKSIEAIVDETRVLKRKGKAALLIVTGKVFNNATTHRSHIILRGLVKDSAGADAEQVRFPCGAFVEDKQLRKVKEGEANRLYEERGSLYNCSMLPESSTSFQMVLENVPPGFDETFKIEVDAVSARIGN